MGADFSIKLIREDSPYLEEIIQLGDANKERFCFSKRTIYKKYASKPGILVALDNENLAGYLMWSVNSRKRIARLWQLCIKSEYQGQKIAKLLHQEFIKQASQLAREIQLECKDKYGIDDMWRTLGYSVIGEKPAKMKGDTLKVWSLQFLSNERSIFSYAFEPSNINFAIDAYSLQEVIEEDGLDSSIEWLHSYLGICITDEFLNEIDDFDYSKRERFKNLITIGQIFKKNCDPNRFNESHQLVKEILLKNHAFLDGTSIRHIARCLASEISYFITQKMEVLQLSSLFLDSGVRIISLEEAIDLQDNNTACIEYQPSRLVNKTVQLKSLNQFKLIDIVALIHQFYPDVNRNKLIDDLRKYSKDQTNYQCLALTYENEPHILVVYDISQEEQMEVPLLRVIKETNLTTTLLNFIVNELLETAIEKNYQFLKITDPYLRETEQITLERQYFTKNPQGFEWVKSCYRNILSSHEIVQYLSHSSKEHSEYSGLSRFLKSWFDSGKILNDPLYCMDIERLLWPLKVKDSYIPSFIVLIKPEYARELFDKNLAKQYLLGIQRTDLFLGLDRVYYKSPKSNAGLNKAPARIFWYVSSSKDHGYSDLSSIRACSQVDTVIIEEPEKVHEKFQHLGYYNLEQIKSCSSSNKVMAIKFSHTELLLNPINQQIIQKCLGRSSSIQFMTKISQEQFIQLYSLGFNLKC